MGAFLMLDEKWEMCWMTDEAASPSLSEVQGLAEAVRANIARVIVGKLDTSTSCWLRFSPMGTSC
jgi:hypothetical protein